MNAKLLIPVALALASATEGQVPLTPMQCGGVRVMTERPIPLQPREFGIEDRGFCSEYTHSAGWENALFLWPGEGADQFLDVIKKAASVWNDAFRYKAIFVMDVPASVNFSVSSAIWNRSETISTRLGRDGRSTIYFVPADSEGVSLGFTNVRMVGNEIEEADIYINSRDVSKHGHNLAKTEQVLEVDDGHAIYAFVDSTFETVLHELGHALGLKHIPIEGNVMSYAYWPYFSEKWEAAMSVFVLNQAALRGSIVYSDPTQIPFVFRKDRVSRYMVVRDEAMLESVEFFTGSAGLGEQDRTALMCVYDF